MISSSLDSKKFLLIISVVVLLSSLTLVNFIHPVFAQTAAEKYTPSIRVIPSSGPPGTEVSIFGTGYPPNFHVLVKIDWTSGTYEEDADASGSFSFDTAAPDVKPGTYEIRAGNIITTYDPNAEFKTSNTYILAHSSFTITGKKIGSNPTKPGVSGGTTPNPPPPPPPQPPTTPTSSSNGGGQSSSFFTINPTSGPPGTVVDLKGGGFTGSILSVFMGGTRLDSATIHSTGDGSISGSVTIPNSAQPGPITISVESSDFTGIAVFTVTGKKVTTTSPTSTLKGTQGTSQPNNPSLPINKKGTLGTGGATSSSGTNSGAPNSPQPAPSPVSKMSGKTSGARFQVIKTVVGGDASPGDFNFIVKLTGPSGSAQYPLNLEWIMWPSAMYDFGLNLPKGNTLSEGNYQMLEMNPGEYTATYSKGCSGSYDNAGYLYTCSVTNTKKVIPNTVASVAKGPKVPLPQPTITPPVSSKTTKSTLSTVPNTGKLTLPTTSKSTGTISKPPTVHSCPTGSVVVNGNCVSKGKIVGILQ